MTAIEPGPRLWVRALAAMIPRLPFGQYWLVSQLRHFLAPPFVMRLPRDMGGLAFHCDQRDSVAREVCFTGRYEPQETQITSRLLHAGDVFVDVGANWGYFSLTAAHRVGRGGRVVAFEPEPRLFALLRANLDANALTWVRARPVAVAAGDGRLAFEAFQLETGNWGRSHAVRPGAAADFECPTVGLDAALDEEGIDTVTLVKIDVEGGEADVIAGMQCGLGAGRYRYVLLECHPALLEARGLTTEECLRPLLHARYRVWLIAHSPDVHRRAARAPMRAADLMRPYEGGQAPGDWPHLLAVAPGAPDPAW